jgi:hypothetical protein
VRGIGYMLKVPPGKHLSEQHLDAVAINTDNQTSL